MKTRTSPTSFPCLSALLALLLLALLASSEALAFQRNISRSGANGQTGSRNISVNRTDNGYTRDTTATGPNNKSASRSTSVARTENGYTKNTSATGPAGNTGTRSTEGHWDAASKTWTKTTSTARGAQ